MKTPTDEVSLIERVIESESPDRTREIGRCIGAACTGGEVILLSGELGAGKTCLTGGIAEGLGIAEPAVSPTYIILRSYRGAGGLALHHADLYRLSGDDDFESAGLEDCFAPDAVVVVEWPERCPEAFGSVALRIRLGHSGEEARTIRLTARGDCGRLIPDPGRKL